MDYNKMKTSTLFLKYVIPQMIGLVFNSIYFIVDGMFIGKRLGTSVLSGPLAKTRKTSCWPWWKKSLPT